MNVRNNFITVSTHCPSLILSHQGRGAQVPVRATMDTKGKSAPECLHMHTGVNCNLMWHLDCGGSKDCRFHVRSEGIITA